MTDSQELAVTGDASGMAAITATPELVQAAYTAIKGGGLPPEVGDPEITRKLILQRIEEGTFEESLDPSKSLPSLQAYAGQPMIFHGFHLNPSSFKENEDSPDAYAIVEVSDPTTGEQDVVQFGGANVLMQLVKAWEESKFPFQAVLTPSKTGQGYTTFWLKWPGDAAGDAEPSGKAKGDA